MLKNCAVFSYAPVKDMTRARDFYENKLGLVGSISDAGTTYRCGGDTAIFVYVSEGAGTSAASAFFWSVDDIGAEVRALKANGVEFERYPDNEWMTFDDDDIARPKDPSRAPAAAWLKDPDGNILALIEG